MKPQFLIKKQNPSDSLEIFIQNRDAEIKDLARKSAVHFAQRNQPALIGDNLDHYTGDIKGGYEKLAADVNKVFRPASHFPESKIDADYFKEKDGNIDVEIEALENQNRNDQFDLGSFNPKTVSNRIWLAAGITGLIMIGEIFFNSKSFQVTGESLLFALILATSISVAVYVFSHLTTLLYKGAKNALQRRLVVIGSTVLILGLFIALAIFRSNYLATHEIIINPTYFVLINLFFFVVSTLISYYMLPSRAEMKANVPKLKKYYAIEKRKKQIQQLKDEKLNIRNTVLNRTKERIINNHHSNYVMDLIRKMYFETIGIFKTTNLTYRPDHRVPDCFGFTVPMPDINEVPMPFLTQNHN